MKLPPLHPAFAVGAIFVAPATLVLLRIHQEPVQPYGWDGAWYIEHVARLEMLELLLPESRVALGEILPHLEGYFPPFQHLVTLAIGSVTGHAAPDVLWQGLIWLTLLAGGVGGAGFLLTGDRRAGWAAAASVLLIPIFPALAARYYGDLPMTSMLWLAVLPALAWGERRPLKAAAVLIPLAFAACLVKWTALVFGPPMIAGALMCARRLDGVPLRAAIGRRLGTAALGVLGLGLLVRLYLAGAGDSSSLSTSLDQMWVNLGRDSSGGGALNAVSSLWRYFADRGGAVEVGSAGKLAWYGLSLATTVFSLSCLPALIWGLGAWAARSRRGLPLATLTLLGQGGFVALVLPLVDERFMMSAVPALGLLAALGWATLGARGRLTLGLLAVLPALLVSAEFHHRVPRIPTASIPLWTPASSRLPPVHLRGAGLAKSVQHRGWSPRADQPPVRQEARDLLWSIIEACEPRAVMLDPADVTAAPLGEWNWLFYRSHLEHLVHHKDHVAVEEGCEKAGKVDLVIGAASPDRPPTEPACGPHWELRGRRSLPEVPFEAVFWARPGWDCPALLE